MNIIFLFLLGVFLNSQVSYGAIEVFSAGKHFSSFEEYKGGLTGSGVAVPQAQQEVPVLDPGEQKLDKISYNNGVHHVLVNFEQNWKNPKPRFVVGADELAYTIEEAMENQHEPTLLISDSQKLRIMSYDPQTKKFIKEKTVVKPNQ